MNRSANRHMDPQEIAIKEVALTCWINQMGYDLSLELAFVLTQKAQEIRQHNARLEHPEIPIVFTSEL